MNKIFEKKNEVYDQEIFFKTSLFKMALNAQNRI